MPAWCSTVMRREMRAALLALAGAAVLALAGLPAAAQLPVRSDNVPGDGNLPRALPVEEAFPWFVSEAAPGQFSVVFNPAPAHYLYRHAFDFRLQVGAEQQSLDFRLPPGLEKNDQFFGDIVAYYKQVTAELDIGRNIPAAAALLIEFQGCADWGFCYPPQQARFELPPR